MILLLFEVMLYAIVCRNLWVLNKFNVINLCSSIVWSWIINNLSFKCHMYHNISIHTQKRSPFFSEFHNTLSSNIIFYFFRHFDSLFLFHIMFFICHNFPFFNKLKKLQTSNNRKTWDFIFLIVEIRPTLSYNIPSQQQTFTLWHQQKKSKKKLLFPFLCQNRRFFTILLFFSSLITNKRIKV